MKFLLKQFFLILLMCSFSSLHGQCNNFNNSIILPVSGTVNNCNGSQPSGPATVCADFNVTFSSGNASFYWGHTVTNNGIPTTTTNGPINTSQSQNFPNIVCVSVPCGASVSFFITSYSNPNGGGNICNGANATFTTAPYSPLPIVLKSFQIIKSGMISKLFWETSSEINNDYFTVERSIDGQIFDNIGEVKSLGNSSEDRYYEYEDKNPIPGFNYYRIKQTDNDGQYSYSDTRSLIHERAKDLVISSKQTEGILQINTTLEDYTVSVYGSEGLEVARYKGMSGQQIVDISALKIGIYFVKVVSGVHSKTVKVIKY